MNVRETISRELHAPARKRYPTRPVELKGVSDLYQADLVEMKPYSKINKGFNYILTIINCFSKLAFAVPLKNKTALEVAKAFIPVLKLNPMRNLQTDDGKEFFNKVFSNILKKYGINHYSTFSGRKGVIIERFNRSLKSLMFRKFTEIGNYNWLKILPSLVKEYNNRKHRTIGMKPIDVNIKNESIVKETIHKNRQYYTKSDKRKKFKVDDKVRLSRFKKIFDKGYLPNWTNEIFTVSKILPTIPVTYKVRDEENNIIKGNFYKQELQKAKLGDIYLVEKVLKRNGNKLLVKWLGFNGTHNSWIHKKELV